MKTVCSGWTTRWTRVLAAAVLTVVVSVAPNQKIVAAGIAGEKAAAPSGLNANPPEPTLAGKAPAFWVISSRSISWTQLQNPADAVAQLRYFQVDRQGHTASAEEPELQEAVGNAETLWIVVHGNRMSSNDAIRFMWGFHEIVKDMDGPKMLWSWPSQPTVRGLARDSRLKAMRSVQEAALLTAWLDRLQPKGRVILVGYSFGAKTLLRAFAESVRTTRVENVQILGGDGEPWVHTAQRVELLLIAPAADASELNEALQAGKQAQVPFRIAMTVNSLDPALKWYRHLWKCRGPNAIGWILPCVAAETSPMLRIIDVTGEVGHTHQWQRYFQSRSVQAILKSSQVSIEAACVTQSGVNR